MIHDLKKYQKGSMLIEALVSLLLFSIGVVAIVTMQAAGVRFSGDAKSRADAAFMAEQIVGVMWADKRSNLASYANNPSGSLCSFSGGASTNANVVSWLGDATKPGTVFGSLPGSTSAYQQIAVDANNNVKVTLCWKTPNDAAAHNYVLATQINGGF